MRFALAAAVLLIASPAMAATPGAWNALDAAARKSCEREIHKLTSKARVSETSGRISGIGAVNDGDRYYGLILSGKTASFASQWLCLYDKRSKSTVAREIEKR